MKNALAAAAFVLAFFQSVNAQITCQPCDQLGMTINVGSDTTALSIYHSGQYMTHPQEHNIFTWNITNSQGNKVFQDTIVDDAFCNFTHDVAITDTMLVTVYLKNDSAVLPNGNPINCLFEDKVFWETGVYPSGNPWGKWEFLNDWKPGLDINDVLGIDNLSPKQKELIKVIDLFGRETTPKTNTLLVYIYSDGSIEKKVIVE
jgi:hypothetical protein